MLKGKFFQKWKKRGGGGDTFEGDKIVPYDVVETYVPILKDESFIGAFEIYLNVTQQIQRIKNIFWNAYIIIVIVIGVLVGFILVFSSKINSSAKEQAKLISELKIALSEVKTLQGIVPICSQCKKIRDDKGYWNNLEKYIQTYSDAKFSHGMCPECSDKLYGDEEWYIEMKKKKDQEE